jgi:hypothetical protein
VSAERVIANLLRIAREDLEGARVLNTCANRNRYTTPTGRIPSDPPTSEVDATAANIESTLVEVAKRLGVDLDAVDQPAANSSPIR